MRSLSASVEGLDHMKPVVGVDLQQLQQDEADRPSFAGRPHLHPRPQFAVHAPKRVIDRFRLHISSHRSSSCKAAVITRQCAHDHLVITAEGVA